MGVEPRLLALLASAGIQPDLAARLARYGALLLDANRRFNLTGAQSSEDLVPHILDSLTLAPYVRDPVVDIGSGGGLPAIPLGLASGAVVTMIESTTKKAAFLEGVLAELSLRGGVVPQRAELAARDPALRERFSTATARAVASAPAVLEMTVPFLRVGGRALLQRGRLEPREREAVADAAPMLGGRLVDEIEVGGERRILVVEKAAQTPQRFPRRPGVPEKRPLCT